MMASTPWKMDRIRMLRQTAALQLTHRAPKYVVCSCQSTEGFMVPKIGYMYSLFLPLDPWKQHNVSNKRRSQIPILSSRLSAIPQSQQPPLPAPFKRQFRHPIWCIWQWQTRILLSFFPHTYMHIKYHMDRNSCLCNGLVQAVATKLAYSSSIYCIYYLVLFEIILCSIGLKNFLSYV